MKNKLGYANWSFAFFLLTLGLALFSWVCSVYGIGEVQSLLSAEGVRWMLGNVVSNYVQAPALGVVFVLFWGLGIMVRSGMWNALKRMGKPDSILSRKERRALMLSVGTLMGYILLVLISVVLPWNITQSVTGTWLHSPFSKGLVYIISLGIGLSGVVYGYVSDTFRRFSEVFDAMSLLITYHASFFVLLFFVIQFFASLAYTHINEWLGISSEMLSMLSQIFSYAPLILGKFYFGSK